MGMATCRIFPFSIFTALELLQKSRTLLTCKTRFLLEEIAQLVGDFVTISLLPPPRHHDEDNPQEDV
jgi:hypothetical protein